MGTIQSLTFKKAATAFAILFVGILWAGPVGTHSILSSSAFAAALTPNQTSAIQNDLTAKIAAINALTYPNEAAKQAAIADAIAQVVEAAILAGADPAGVASAVIAYADSNGLPSATVGDGLGAAAAHLASGNPDAATAIAQVVANEGSVALRNAFNTSVAENGGPAELITVANSTPQLNNSNSGAKNQDTSSGGTPPPCDNPSCS